MKHLTHLLAAAVALITFTAAVATPAAASAVGTLEAVNVLIADIGGVTYYYTPNSSPWITAVGTPAAAAGDEAPEAVPAPTTTTPPAPVVAPAPTTTTPPAPVVAPAPTTTTPPARAVVSEDTVTELRCTADIDNWYYTTYGTPDAPYWPETSIYNVTTTTYDDGTVEATAVRTGHVQLPSPNDPLRSIAATLVAEVGGTDYHIFPIWIWYMTEGPLNNADPQNASPLCPANLRP